MKSGFVNILGKPNAGKSTLLNALLGEKLAIVSPKVQTTRHRIKGILNGDGYQVIFSDTPGMIEPKYKLHEKMMHAVKSSLEDADVALLMVDVHDDFEAAHELFGSLTLKVSKLLVINKIDTVTPDKVVSATAFFENLGYYTSVMAISAETGAGVPDLLSRIIALLPEGEPFYADDHLSDLPVKFFVGEIIREKIFFLFEEEIPYHTTVLVQEFKEKVTLTKIRADIIVQRETQKGILLGHKGSKIKEIGSLARKEIEEFIGTKVFLELFVKVRPKWRDNEMHLREYGY